jgi:hypothetical protein
LFCCPANCARAIASDNAQKANETVMEAIAPALDPAPAPAVQQGQAAAGLDASCVLVSAPLYTRALELTTPTPLAARWPLLLHDSSLSQK